MMAPPSAVAVATASARMVLPLALGAAVGVVGVLQRSIELIVLSAPLLGFTGFKGAVENQPAEGDDDAEG